MGFHLIAPSKDRDGLSEWEGLSQVPIGRGIDEVQLLLLDDNNRLCGEGVTGEICIRTRHRAVRIEDINGCPSASWINNPFSANPDDVLYRTGDFGHYIQGWGCGLRHGWRDRQVKAWLSNGPIRG